MQVDKNARSAKALRVFRMKELWQAPIAYSPGMPGSAHGLTRTRRYLAYPTRMTMPCA